MFICSDTLSTIALTVPDQRYSGLLSMDERLYEVVMRDCSRQIHWMFPSTKQGVVKARKVANFFTELADGIESIL